jgi:hypothetical protein
MVNPLKYDSGDLRIMTDAELGYAIYQILNAFASSNSGAGTLNTTGTGTAIGTFSDTKRPDPVGSHPVGTSVTTTTTSVYQDLTSVSESLTKPVEFSSNHIRIQNDTQLNDSLIAAALNELVDNGLGVYRLQPTSPTQAGTWVQVITITNTTQSGNNTTHIWRRTGAVAPSKLQPLKSTATGDLKVMTDAELQSLTNRMRNRIISTGIGQYKLQSTTPSGGTWVKMGDSFYDTRHDIGNVNYASFSSSSFTGTSSQNFTGYSSSSYAGYYGRSYAGAYGRSFAGSYTRYYNGRNAGNYTGYYGRNFIGYYARFFTGYYSRSFSGNYTRFYTGYFSRSFAGYYTGATVLGTTSNISDVALWIRTA